MTITAHAGALGTAPNTLESVEICMRAAPLIEVDVRFCGDTPILSHDKNKNAPPLEDCLALLAGTRTGVNLDMKEHSHIAGIVALVRQYGLEGRAFFTGVRAREVDAVRESGLPYYLNCVPKRMSRNAGLVQAAVGLGCVGLNIHYKAASAKLLKEAHAAGLLVSVWTVDTAAAMRQMIRLGVDNLTTHRPDLCEGLLHAV